MRSQSEISNALAVCLQKIEAGSTVEQALASFPQLADDLRSLLTTAQTAQQAAERIRIPASAQVDSRRRMLIQAQKMKKRRISTLYWALVDFFRHNAGSVAFAISAVALIFLAIGSTRALPGDSLYPVKIAAEQAESAIVSGSAQKNALEDGFDTLRAAEVAQMIQDQRTGTVRFGGYLSKNNADTWQAAGIALNLTQDNKQKAQSLLDVYVEINGVLDAKGQVNVKAIQARTIPVNGTLAGVNGETWAINHLTLRVNKDSIIHGTPGQGKAVTIQAARLNGTQDLLVMSASFSDAYNQKTSEPNEVVVPTIVTPTPTQTPTLQPTPAPTQFVAPADDPSNASSSSDQGNGSDSGSDDSSDNHKKEQDD
jgi:hypothetical protein